MSQKGKSRFATTFVADILFFVCQRLFPFPELLSHSLSEAKETRKPQMLPLVVLLAVPIREQSWLPRQSFAQPNLQPEPRQWTICLEVTEPPPTSRNSASQALPIWLTPWHLRPRQRNGLRTKMSSKSIFPTLWMESAASRTRILVSPKDGLWPSFIIRLAEMNGDTGSNLCNPSTIVIGSIDLSIPEEPSFVRVSRNAKSPNNIPKQERKWPESKFVSLHLWRRSNFYCMLLLNWSRF